MQIQRTPNLPAGSGISLDLVLRNILGMFNKGIEIDNLLAEKITIADSGAADSENTVNHNLGFIPTSFMVTYIDSGGIVYASRRADWTITQIFLRCSAANAAIEFLVLR